MSYKQIIIVRKDLEMSRGKMAAQVSHASMAFLTSQMRRCYQLQGNYNEHLEDDEQYKKNGYAVFVTEECYKEWISGSFTKIVLGAKNRHQLLRAKLMAEELGMKEGEDFFLIKDNCLTELEPEDDGRTLTCIGFTPMDSEVIDAISRKYQLFS